MFFLLEYFCWNISWYDLCLFGLLIRFSLAAFLPQCGCSWFLFNSVRVFLLICFLVAFLSIFFQVFYPRQYFPLIYFRCHFFCCYFHHFRLVFLPTGFNFFNERFNMQIKTSFKFRTNVKIKMNFFKSIKMLNY